MGTCQVPGCEHEAVTERDVYGPYSKHRFKLCTKHAEYVDKQHEALRKREAVRAAQRAEENRKREAAWKAQQEEDDRRLQADIERGSPGRMSPAAVIVDGHFEHVVSVDGNTWPASIQRVVKNKALGTLWSARFSIRTDDSDADEETNWTEVEARQVTTTVYEPVKSSRG